MTQVKAGEAREEGEKNADSRGVCSMWTEDTERCSVLEAQLQRDGDRRWSGDIPWLS